MRSLRIVIGALCLLASAHLTHGKKNEQTPPAATGSNPKTKTMGTAGHHGPYEAVGQMLKEEKKKSQFFSLLKQLKEVKNAKTSCDATCIATRKNLNDQIHTVVGETAFAKYHSIHLAQAQNYKNTHPAAGAQPAPAGQKSKAGSSSTGGSSAKKTDGVTKKKKPAGPTP